MWPFDWILETLMDGCGCLIAAVGIIAVILIVLVVIVVFGLFG